MIYIWDSSISLIYQLGHLEWPLNSTNQYMKNPCAQNSAQKAWVLVAHNSNCIIRQIQVETNELLDVQEERLPWDAMEQVYFQETTHGTRTWKINAKGMSFVKIKAM